ncbi:MAG: F0F1 ATP synthase subunit epsilon, partial [Phycisphaerae bacterium]|nr:F0F1 ATP synthase subunit epsilon [Phycisphaerae bacterium]
MADTLRCSVVTPVESLFEGHATYVNLPAWDGQLGVMPQTSPFLTRLGTGVLTIEQDSAARRFAVDGGFAQMQEGVLTLLTDGGIAA